MADSHYRKQRCVWWWRCSSTARRCCCSTADPGATAAPQLGPAALHPLGLGLRLPAAPWAAGGRSEDAWPARLSASQARVYTQKSTQLAEKFPLHA